MTNDMHTLELNAPTPIPLYCPPPPPTVYCPVFSSRLSQQVVDKIDDDAWGLSAALPVGVEVSSINPDSDSSAETKLGLVIGLCAGGERCKRKGSSHRAESNKWSAR